MESRTVYVALISVDIYGGNTGKKAASGLTDITIAKEWAYTELTSLIPNNASPRIKNDIRTAASKIKESHVMEVRTEHVQVRIIEY